MGLVEVALEYKLLIIDHFIADVFFMAPLLFDRQHVDRISEILWHDLGFKMRIQLP